MSKISFVADPVHSSAFLIFWLWFMQHALKIKQTKMQTQWVIAILSLNVLDSELQLQISQKPNITNASSLTGTGLGADLHHSTSYKLYSTLTETCFNKRTMKRTRLSGFTGMTVQFKPEIIPEKFWQASTLMNGFVDKFTYLKSVTVKYGQNIQLM